ncbi:MFS transporter [Microbacterium sp. No. 7]|uniref:MFS transporter n=1 Tax=Microbacterium sp. No. 7 TaxID=1714373 RepID=UPI0006CFF508|nr:MFS transporter [Microbacterium sp. No. 7]ALJ21547.1 MFS transporter [Microbacterium sp. No. 7]
MREFTGHVPGSSEYRRLLIGLFFAGVATFSQLYGIQAVLPFIAETFTVSPATASLTLSVATLGVAATVIAWSTVADRIGRIRAMATGLVAAVVFGVLASFAPTFELLIAARLLEGVSLGAIPALALAYIAEEVDVRHTAAAAGSYIAGNSIGGLVGRFVEGPLGDLGLWRQGVLAVAVLCAIATVLFLRLSPPARGFVAGRTRESGGPSLAARIAMNLRDRGQLSLYAQGALLMGSLVGVYNYLGFRLTAPPFSLPLWVASFVFVAYLAGTLSSPWAGRITARLGRSRVLLGALAFMVVGLSITLVDALWAIIVGLPIFTAGYFAAHTVVSGWVPAVARPEARAQAAALFSLSYYTGAAVFGWALGFVFSGAGWTGLAAAVGTMVALAGLLLLATPRPTPR